MESNGDDAASAVSFIEQMRLKAGKENLIAGQPAWSLNKLNAELKKDQ
jgi:hypothetical protein